MVAGLMRMAPVAIMLLGTGTLAGIIANSNLKDVLIPCKPPPLRDLPSRLTLAPRVWRHDVNERLQLRQERRWRPAFSLPRYLNLAFPPGGSRAL